MRILTPAPLPEFTSAKLTDVEPELVTSKSPVWKHREIFARAAFFRREFQYDFVQWESSTGDDDPDVHGFIFADETDAIVGACAFRLRDRNGVKRWGLQWVWVCPRAQRTGVLARRWSAFKRRFGVFHVEGPVSRAMESFVVRQGDVGLLGYDPDQAEQLARRVGWAKP
jgi:hypothetical protein